MMKKQRSEIDPFSASAARSREFGALHLLIRLSARRVSASPSFFILFFLLEDDDKEGEATLPRGTGRFGSEWWGGFTEMRILTSHTPKGPKVGSRIWGKWKWESHMGKLAICY